MANGKKIVRTTAIVLGVTSLIVPVGWVWSIHSFRISISHENLQPLELVIKKAASDIVVVKQPVSSVRVQSASRGYLAAYQQDPKGFQSDSKLFDTWFTATELAAATLQHSAGGNWIHSSSDADYVAPTSRIDPWGHAFCLLRREDTLLVISAGPSAPSSPVCKDIQIGAAELSQLTQGKLLQSPSGSLIFVTSKNNQKERPTN